MEENPCAADDEAASYKEIKKVAIGASPVLKELKTVDNKFSFGIHVIIIHSIRKFY